MRTGQTGQAKLTWRMTGGVRGDDQGLGFIARDEEGTRMWRVLPYITRRAYLEHPVNPVVSHWTVERWAFVGEGFSGGVRSKPGWERFPTPGHCHTAEEAMAIAEKGCC